MPSPAATSRAPIGVAAGAACIGLAPIFVKAIGAPPETIAFFRTFLGACLLLPFAIKDIQAWAQHATVRDTLPIFGAGLAFTLDLAVWHRSIDLAGAGIATILGNLQVFFSGLLGWLVLKEHLSWRWSICALLAVFGIVLLVGGLGNVSLSGPYLAGIGFGLATAPCYAAYVLGLRQTQAARHPLSAKGTLTLVLFVTALSSGLFGAVQGASFALNGTQWLQMAGLALVSQVLGWMLIASNLTLVPLALSGLILLIQPVLATALGVALFDEHLDRWQVLGATITLVAIYFATLSKGARHAQKKRPGNAPMDNLPQSKVLEESASA